MNPRYILVAARAEHRCEYCHAPECIFNLPFEIEHIVPPAHQGPDDESNWALACRSCNLSKSNHLTGWDVVADGEVRLFHPRHDSWAEHFLANPTTGEIEGRSPVGRSTVSRCE
jgi:hypothetical protein